MLLNITNLSGYGNQNFQLARMGSIPHGNSILCLGNAATEASPVIDPNSNSALPTTVAPTRQMPVDY